MSKSYKKSPWSGDKKGKWKKRRASKVVRRYLQHHPENPCQGAQYKKIYCSWNICDYGLLNPWKNYWTFVRAVSANNTERSKEDEYRQWYRRYKAK